MNFLKGTPEHVRSIERTATEVQLTSEAAWALYFSNTDFSTRELPPLPTVIPPVEFGDSANKPLTAPSVHEIGDLAEFEICSSCNGDGHFDEAGSPTSDPHARYCVTCDGLGVLPKPV